MRWMVLRRSQVSSRTRPRHQIARMTRRPLKQSRTSRLGKKKRTKMDLNSLHIWQPRADFQKWQKTKTKRIKCKWTHSLDVIATTSYWPIQVNQSFLNMLTCTLYQAFTQLYMQWSLKFRLINFQKNYLRIHNRKVYLRKLKWTSMTIHLSIMGKSLRYLKQMTVC